MGKGFTRDYKLRFYVDTEKEVHEITPVIELILDDPEKDISDDNKYKYLKTFSMSVDENYHPKETLVNNIYMGVKKRNEISKVLTKVLSTDDTGLAESVIMYIFLTNLYKIITENTGVDLLNKLFKEMRLYAFSVNTDIGNYVFANDLDGDVEDELFKLFVAISGYSEGRNINLDDLDIDYDEEYIEITGVVAYDYTDVSRELIFSTSIPYEDNKSGAICRVNTRFKDEIIKRDGIEITDSVLRLMANVLIYYKLIMNE